MVVAGDNLETIGQIVRSEKTVQASIDQHGVLEIDVLPKTTTSGGLGVKV